MPELLFSHFCYVKLRFLLAPSLSVPSHFSQNPGPGSEPVEAALSWGDETEFSEGFSLLLCHFIPIQPLSPPLLLIHLSLPRRRRSPEPASSVFSLFIFVSSSASHLASLSLHLPPLLFSSVSLWIINACRVMICADVSRVRNDYSSSLRSLDPPLAAAHWQQTPCSETLLIIKYSGKRLKLMWNVINVWMYWRRFSPVLLC